MDEGTKPKWRIAHLADNPKAERQLVSDFQKAYLAANKPNGMAMFSHVDTTGMFMGISISPEAAPYCPFSATWEECDDARSFGNSGWIAGDERLK